MREQTTRWLVKEVGKCLGFVVQGESRAAIAVLNLEGSFHLLLLIVLSETLPWRFAL